MATLHEMANALRFLSIDMVEKAKSGHPGMPMGMADIATVLFTKFMRIDSSKPRWFDRDRFVLSNGHGSALLYSLLYMMGYSDSSLNELKNFRQFGSKTAGHPEMELLQGVDFSTGPLGQGLAGAVGMALAERMMNARYGDDLVNHKTYVFVGDGCLMEGISEEAISLAGHWKLNKLIALWDDNAITIDGATSMASSTNIRARFEANGWHVLSCDGHDFDSIETALTKAQNATKPVLIACKTTIGFGSPNKAGKSAAHGAPLGPEEVAKTREALGWKYPPFEIPEEILFAWKVIGIKGEGRRQQWEDRVARDPEHKQFMHDISGKIPASFKKEMAAFKNAVLADKTPIASRKSSQKTLTKLVQIIPNLVGGSADLTAANFTNTPDSVFVTSECYGGNYINYGIREHVMGAIMNGIAAHSGFIPYSGTFLAFLDYMKPAVRMAALMKLRVLYVFTHDSIGVGEDGPTHQPIEQLITLRATPNVLCFRPADAVEVAECYEVALENMHGPSAMILSRQDLPLLRSSVVENRSAKGAYVLYEPDCPRQVTLIATGSEVAAAIAAKEILEKSQVAAAVISMPCMDLFEEQSQDYQAMVLGSAPRVAIEAASPYGWDKWVGGKGLILGIDHFGQSAPGKVLFKKYGLAPEDIATRVLALIEGV